MTAIRLHAVEGLTVDLVCDEADAFFVAHRLALTHAPSATTAEFALVRPVSLPREAVNTQALPMRLKRLAEVQASAPATADYRSALHALAVARLVPQGGLLGLQLAADADLSLELNLAAVLDGPEIEASASGRLVLKARCETTVQRLGVGGLPEAPDAAGVELDLHLVVAFEAEFAATIELPTLQFALPRLPLPSLALPGLRWPSGDGAAWQLPGWLSSLQVPIAVAHVALAAEVSSGGVRVTADRVEVAYDSSTVVEAVGVVLDSSGGSKADLVRFSALTLAPRTANAPLGLPLVVAVGQVQVTPRLENLKSWALSVHVQSLALTEAGGTTLRFAPVSFQVRRSGLSDFEVTLVDGVASVKLLLAVAEFAAAAGERVASLVQWTLAQGAAATTLLARLLDFLFRVALPAPRLPGVGPIRAGFAALLKFIQDAADELSVQLVFERSTHRLLRTVVAARHRPSGEALDVRYGGSALSLHLRSASLRARLALVIEHQGPSAGDWFFAAVPAEGDAGAWFAATLATDLWLNTADTTQLAQDSEEGGRLPPEPLLQLTAQSTARQAVALFGVRSGRALWFHRFAGEAMLLPSTGAPQVHLALAEGAYRLQPIGSDDLDIDFEWSPAKARRLLPFLSDPQDEGSGLSQLIRLKEYAYDKAGRTVTLTLEFGKKDEPVAEAQVAGRWSLSEWRLSIDPEIRFALPAGTQSKSWDFLGLDWVLQLEEEAAGGGAGGAADTTVFVLRVDGEPSLTLAPRAKLAVSANAFGGDNGRLRFEVSEFGIGRSGLSLDARLVPEGPVELAGVKTRFQFKAAELVIRDSRIRELMLAASGSLPAWIGDAKVDASFRLGQNATSGRFELLSAWAQLQSPGKKIEAKALRFEFSLRKIEFEFKSAEEAGAPHHEFYFLVSGSAEFKPNGAEFDAGLLKHLKNAKLELNRAPVTSDLGKLLGALKLTVPLPKSETIRLFNLFEFEIRSVAFAVNAFGQGDHGISLGGQCKFAAAGDVISADIDFHAMTIGLPRGSNPLPRVRFEGLRVALAVASRIRLSGTVMAVDRDLPLTSVVPDLDPGLTAHGFVGDGVIDIPGMPTLSAAFGFLEIERSEGGVVDRQLSWFVYVQAEKLSYRLPAPIPLFMREVGFGLGFRYTLAGIAAADKVLSTAELIQSLDELATRQGDMARYSAWRPQFGGRPKLTLAMRALLTMASASPPQLHRWRPSVERELVSPLTMDVVAALRDDFTFLMTVRVWLSVNYHDFVTGGDSLRTRPLVKGFMYLSGPKQEFLARLTSSDNPHIGKHPIVPELVQRALGNLQYSSTLYMRPGLLHFELGWPNQLRWSDTFGPLTVACEGGFVFRVENGQLLLGMNFGARGQLELSASIGSSSFGASIAALAQVAFVNRMIALIDARQIQGSMYYGLVAIDLHLRFTVSAWLRIRIFGVSIGFSIGFSFSLQVSVALELVLTGEPDVAGRARCRVALRAFGRSITVQVNLAHNAAKVDRARARVARYLDLGLTGPAEALADPFAADTTAATVRASRAGIRFKGAERAVPALHAATLGAFVRRLAWRPAGTATDHLLVAWVPQGDQPGFYCAPRIGGDGKPVPDNRADYRWAKLPAGTLVYRDGQWLPAVGGVAETRVAWARKLAADGDLTLANLLDNAFIDLDEGTTNPPRYVDPQPRVFESRAQPAGGASAEQRGRDLQSANDDEAAVEADAEGTKDAHAVANDARDLLLAQLLDAVVGYAEDNDHTGYQLAPDLGVVLLVPAPSDAAGLAGLEQALRGVELHRIDPDGTATLCPVRCDPLELAVFAETSPRGGAQLDLVQSRFDNERVEFAWDLVWGRPSAADEPEPEQFLFAYEIHRQVVGSDRIGRTWRVRPADNVRLVPAANGGAPTWQHQRAWRQFVDDFSDLPAVPEDGKTVDYSITPVAIDGSRGEVRRLSLTIARPRRIAAPVQADLDFVLGLAGVEISLQAAELRLRLSDEQPPVRAAVVLRPEPLRLGGHYGIDQDSQSGEALGTEAAVLPGDLHFEFETFTPAPASGAPEEKGHVFAAQLGTSAIGAQAAALSEGRGRKAWRAYVRLTDATGALASPLVPVHLKLLRREGAAAATQVVVPVFEWPFVAPGLQTLPVSGSAGALRPRTDAGRAGGDEAAFADEVGIALQWPYRPEQPASPPVAGYRLFELALDELPPRLLDGECQPLPEAALRAEPLAELKLVEPELLPLNPHHNRDTEAWAGTYVPTVGGLPVAWPSPEARHVLARAEAELLAHLRGALGRGDGLHWPSHIAVRVQKRWKDTDAEKDLFIEGQRLHFVDSAVFESVPRAMADARVAVFALVRDNFTEHELAAALRGLRIDPKAGESVQWPYTVEVAPMSDAQTLDPALWFEVVGSKCHPDLIAFAEALAGPAERVEYQSAFEDEAGFESGDDLVQATPEASDPMGFGILLRMGMAVTLRIWHAVRRRYVPPDELEKRWHAMAGSPAFAGLSIHVDQLMQTEQHLWVQPFDARVPAEAGDIGSRGLALLQLSLRPRAGAPSPKTREHHALWWRLRELAPPEVKVPYDGEPSAQDRQWEQRFLRHGLPVQADATGFTRTFAARQGSPGDLVAPDAQGAIRWLRRSKDLHAHVRAYAVAVIGRYDDMIYRVLGSTADDDAATPLSALPTTESAWQAVRIDRSKPVDAPQLVWNGHASLAVAAAQGPVQVPVWEIGLGQHGEQSLAESNDLVATRLQFRGIGLRLSRAPRESDWFARINTELAAQAQPVLDYTLMPDNPLEAFAGLPEFERALREQDFAPQPGPYAPLWQGVTMLRLPALPYFYRHRIEVKAHAGLRESAVNHLDEALPPRPYRAAPERVQPTLDAQGRAVMAFVPTLYHDLSDPFSDQIAGEPTATSGPTRPRHAPDPDVQYELRCREGDMVEPLVHVLRESRDVAEAGPRAYRSLPRSRRVRSEATLHSWPDRADPTRRLEMQLTLLQTQELEVRQAPLPDFDLEALASYDPANKRLALLRIPDETDMQLLSQAWGAAPPAWLEPQLLGPVVQRWLFSGAVDASAPDAWPGPVQREFETEFVLDGKVLAAGSEWRGWLQAWLQTSVWQSRPLRTGLNDGIAAAVSASSSVTLRLRGVSFQVDAGPLAVPPGIRIAAHAPTGRWLAFGAPGEALRAAVAAVAAPGEAERLADEGLRRVLGRVGTDPEFILERWRGQPPGGQQP